MKANQLESTLVEMVKPNKEILSLVVLTKIQVWMFFILKITS